MQIENEAVQIEVQEAMQIEVQARVNQDPSNSHLPATAWPRQMLAVFYDPPLAGNSGWLYRLGCRVPTYKSEVRGREPPGTEITEQVISQGKS